MKILINRKPVEGPWGGGNLFIKNFYDIMKKLGHEVVYKFEEEIDVVFIMNPRYDSLGISINEVIQYKNYNPKTKIIQRINDCDSRKNTTDVDQMLLQCSGYLDATIFVSNWMKNYFIEKGWKCQENFVLVNGVETFNFKKNKKKINNSKINIVTHHWSNNYLKGFDIYDKLDKFIESNSQYSFTYIGRDRGSFKNTKVIKPLHGESLYTELKKYDLYVSASRWDPGPNHILESISCGLPTYVHHQGGGCVEFADPDHVFKDFNDLEKIIENKNYVKNKFKVYNWNICIEKLSQLMSRL